MTPVRPRTSWPGRGGAGIGLAVLSAATFGTSGTFAASLISAGWSPAAAVLSRMALSAIILTVPALVQLRGRWARLRRHAGQVAAYGVIAVAGCQLFYFSAIQRMPVGVALLLEYLGAVLVVGWLWLRYGQRPRRLTIIGAAVAISGLALVLNLAGSTRIDPLGVMWGLLAAVGLAIYFLLSAGTGSGARGSGAAESRVRGPGAAAEPLPPIVMAWAGMCVGGAALGLLGWAGALPLRAPAGPVSFLGHRVSWIVPVVGLALVAAVIAYVAGIGAARRLGAKLASFIGMAEVLFAILFAWILLGQLPSGVQFLGGALILAGVALVRVDELHGAGREDGTPDRTLVPVDAGSAEHAGRPRAAPRSRAGRGGGSGPEPAARSRPAAAAGAQGRVSLEGV